MLHFTLYIALRVEWFVCFSFFLSQSLILNVWGRVFPFSSRGFISVDAIFPCLSVLFIITFNRSASASFLFDKPWHVHFLSAKQLSDDLPVYSLSFEIADGEFPWIQSQLLKEGKTNANAPPLVFFLCRSSPCILNWFAELRVVHSRKCHQVRIGVACTRLDEYVWRNVERKKRVRVSPIHCSDNPRGPIDWCGWQNVSDIFLLIFPFRPLRRRLLALLWLHLVAWP